MPLVIITGFPSSGKTKLARELKDFFEKEKDKKVSIVSENELIDKEKNVVMSDSRREKDVRGALKADALRMLNKDDVLILDAANYIKGFRYELYCASKQIKTPQCVMQTVVSPEEAWGWNTSRPAPDQYSREVFDGLVMRYECPNSSNRWDAPLFAVLAADTPPYEAVYEALYHCKPPPPNQSTQTQPLSSTNFLYELDRTTQDVNSRIMSAQKTMAPGAAIKITGVDEAVSIGRTVTLGELARARRQFITYTKMHPVEDTTKLMSLFVQYLNTTLS